MDAKRHLLWLWMAAVLMAAGGAGCPQMLRSYTSPPPPVLPPSPSLQQVIAAVNDNSSRIYSFSSNQATLSVPGAPTLRANLAMLRPRCFRLRAESALLGPQVDIGSNDELFWFWVRQSQQPAIYYCRHDLFDSGRARAVIPIAPERLIEAMGIVAFDPALPHHGPFKRPDGRLEIHTFMETPGGASKRVTIVDENYGYVLAQHLYDPQNRLALSVVAKDHRRDPLSGLTMPKSVSIHCPLNNFSMELDLGNVEINTLDSGRQELWAMPNYRGSPMVDLGQ